MHTYFGIFKAKLIVCIESKLENEAGVYIQYPDWK